jgi:hypothetical protein
VRALLAASELGDQPLDHRHERDEAKREGFSGAQAAVRRPRIGRDVQRIVSRLGR